VARVADRLHVLAQQRLRQTTADRVAAILATVPLDRAPEFADAYRAAVATTVQGGQRAAAQMALAYMAAYFPPEENPDLAMVLEPILLTPDDPGAIAGLARLWELLGEGMDEAEAREAAEGWAGDLASNNVQTAAREGLDEGARVGEYEGRWRLEPNPGACEWCLFLADTGARYHSAETVPVPHSPNNPHHRGGPCGCSPAPGEE
jgi:hypothetical protein